MLAEQLVWATPSLNACLEIVFLLSLASFYSMEKSVAPHEPFLIATGAETPRQRQQTLDYLPAELVDEPLAYLPELQWLPGAELVEFLPRSPRAAAPARGSGAAAGALGLERGAASGSAVCDR